MVIVLIITIAFFPDGHDPPFDGEACAVVDNTPNVASSGSTNSSLTALSPFLAA